MASALEQEAPQGLGDDDEGRPPGLMEPSDSLGSSSAPSLLSDGHDGSSDEDGSAALPRARGGLGVLDEIDHSDRGEAGPGPFGDFGAGLLGAMSPERVEEHMAQSGLSDGLLQQIPVQDLLEIMMRAGGQPMELWTSNGLVVSAISGFELPSSFAARPTIPAGLDASSHHHAQLMASQGFATALDPARHAACAAEGVPGGRRQASPRPAANRPAGGAAAVPAGSAGRAPPALGRPLQRGDSAASSGGALPRGDSARSQGSAGGLLRPAGAMGPVRRSRSRLAHAARRPARAAGSVGGSSDEGPPLLLPESDSGTGGSPSLATASSSSSEGGGAQPVAPRTRRAALRQGSDGQPHAWQQRTEQRRGAGPAAEAAATPGEPPHRRPRRNAVFGQLPGLGGAAAQGMRASGGRSRSVGSDEAASASASSSEGSRRRHLRARLAAAPPPLGNSNGSASDGSSDAPPLEGYSDGALSLVGGSGGSDSGGSDSGGSAGPPGLLGDSGGSDGPPGLLGNSSDGRPGLLSDEGGSDDGGSGSNDGPPSLERDLSGAEGSRAWPAPRRAGLPRNVPLQRDGPPPGPAPRRGSTPDQRAVMQALTSLLPRQADARSWAELAAVVRHAGGGASGGGVQLLSRLVAAAVGRFPAEAEAAGITERPLAPPRPPPAAVQSRPAALPDASSQPSAQLLQGGGVGEAAAGVTFVFGSQQAVDDLQQQLGPGVAAVAAEDRTGEQPEEPPAA